MKLILTNEVLMLHKGNRLLYRCRSGFCKYGKFACRYTGWCKGAGIQLCLRNAHQITRFVHTHFDMGRTRRILDAAVSIVAHHGHAFRCLRHIRIAAVKLVIILFQILLKLIICL